MTSSTLGLNKIHVYRQGGMTGSKVHVHLLSSRPACLVCVCMTLIIHEMLRKKGKATQHNRKTEQCNTTQLTQGSYFSKKKLAGTRVHVQVHVCVPDSVPVCMFCGC